MQRKKLLYALCALEEIAARGPGAVVSKSQIAEACAIPERFLEHILIEMRFARLIASIRGKHGGYYLPAPAHELAYAAPTRLILGSAALAPCAVSDDAPPCPGCRAAEHCPVRTALIGVRLATEAALEVARFGKRTP